MLQEIKTLVQTLNEQRDAYYNIAMLPEADH